MSANVVEAAEAAGASERKMRIFVNSDVKMSRGKYAAMAVHAALLSVGAHPGVPVIVLGGPRGEIADMETTVTDAGRTEIEPGTLAAGTDWGLGGERGRGMIGGKRRYSASDHILLALFDQQDAFGCDVCGLKTERTTGVVHWLRWVAHDLTTGWGKRHWAEYHW